MDGRQPARLRADFADSIDDWVGRQGRPRSVLDAAVTGTPPLVRLALLAEQQQATPHSEILALAAPAHDDGSRPAAPPQSGWRDARDQVFAGLRGAKDSLPFDLGDRTESAAGALWDMAHGAGWRDAYDRRMVKQHESDEFDVVNYPTARTVGKVLGTGAQIAVLGPLEGAVAGGARMAQAAPLIARELAVLGGAGGAAGVGGQAIADLAQRRVSSLGDYLGAAAGGAAGAFASRLGQAGHAGAIGGATTSLVQDVASGRPFTSGGVLETINRAADAAGAGSHLGAIGGVAGRYWSNQLPRGPGGRTTQGFRDRNKQGLGEGFARVRTWSRGDRVGPGGEVRVRGGETYPDHRSFRGSQERDIVEAKFGRKAKLDDRQREAYRELPNYRVDHTLPQDVGVIFGFPLSVGGYQSVLRGDGGGTQ